MQGARCALEVDNGTLTLFDTPLHYKDLPQ